MAISEMPRVVLWRAECDLCGFLEAIANTTTPDPPDGWVMKEVGPCGHTNYFRDELRCPACKDKP
jgi:hypothetical protein